MDHLDRMKRQYAVAEDRGDIVATTTLGQAIRTLDAHRGHDERYQTDCPYCDRDMDEAARYWGAIFRSERHMTAVPVEPERDWDFIRDELRHK
jgi:hypothetical protein